MVVNTNYDVAELHLGDLRGGALLDIANDLNGTWP